MEKNLFISMETNVNFSIYFDYEIDDQENIDAQ